MSVSEGDGTLGWAQHAPYDSIIVSAGGPAVPKALLEQLAIGGRLVMPVGARTRAQRLLRVTRRSADEFVEDELGAVVFVPLIGAQGWVEGVEGQPRTQDPRRASRSSSTSAVGRLIHENAEPIDDIDSVSLGPLLERIGNAQVVLLGEAPPPPLRLAGRKNLRVRRLARATASPVWSQSGGKPRIRRAVRLERRLLLLPSVAHGIVHGKQAIYDSGVWNDVSDPGGGPTPPRVSPER